MNKLKRKLLFIFVLFVYCTSNAQTDTVQTYIPLNREFKEVGIVTGVHQFKNTYLEIGIAKTKSKTGCVWGSYYDGISLSTEYNPFQNKAGLVYTMWTSAMSFFILGANVNSYTDFDKCDIGVKPFIGLGPGNISLTYGYNFQILDNSITDLNSHTISLRYFFAMKTRSQN